MTKDTSAYPSLVDMFSKLNSPDIFNGMPIDWESVSWSDLTKPLYSAISVRLYISILTEDVPRIGDLGGQASYWRRNYDYDAQSDDGMRENHFKERVAHCQGIISKLFQR